MLRRKTKSTLFSEVKMAAAVYGLIVKLLSYGSSHCCLKIITRLRKPKKKKTKTTTCVTFCEVLTVTSTEKSVWMCWSGGNVMWCASLTNFFQNLSELQFSVTVHISESSFSFCRIMMHVWRHWCKTLIMVVRLQMLWKTIGYLSSLIPHGEVAQIRFFGRWKDCNQTAQIFMKKSYMGCKWSKRIWVTFVDIAIVV